MCTRAFESLSAKELADIQDAKMMPGQMSESGFLMPGDNLVEIYKADKKYLDTVDITYQQIADTLETVIEKTARKLHHHYERTKEAYPDFVVIDGRYKVKHVSYMGAQQCPFQDPADKRYYGYQYGSADLTVTDMKTAKTLTFNTLLPHMIEHHHFFESPNVSHRLDPRDVIEMFEIQPDQNRKTELWTEYGWSQGSSGSHQSVTERHQMMAIGRVLAIDKYEDENVICYMMPCQPPQFDPETSAVASLADILPSTTTSVEQSWQTRYHSARMIMFEQDNRRVREFNAMLDKIASESTRSKETTEEEMSSAIKSELDLVQRYRENKIEDLLTGLDYCLMHPENKATCMHITIARKPLARSEEVRFKIGGVETVMDRYSAYRAGQLRAHHFAPVEEDLM